MFLLQDMFYSIFNRFDEWKDGPRGESVQNLRAVIKNQALRTAEEAAVG
jgi:hypothetical protein